MTEVERILRSALARQQAPATPTTLTVGEFEYRGDTERTVSPNASVFASTRSALQWDDFDFEKNQLLVQRSFVSGRVDDVKTEYSQDYVPLHPSLTEIVLEWSKEAVPTEEGWVFANPVTERPYHPTEIQKRHLRPSGKRMGRLWRWCSSR